MKASGRPGALICTPAGSRGAGLLAVTIGAGFDPVDESAVSGAHHHAVSAPGSGNRELAPLGFVAGADRRTAYGEIEVGDVVAGVTVEVDLKRERVAVLVRVLLIVIGLAEVLSVEPCDSRGAQLAEAFDVVKLSGAQFYARFGGGDDFGRDG